MARTKRQNRRLGIKTRRIRYSSRTNSKIRSQRKNQRKRTKERNKKFSEKSENTAIC